MSDDNNFDGVGSVLEIMECWREENFNETPALEPANTNWGAWGDPEWNSWALAEIKKVVSDWTPPKPDRPLSRREQVFLRVLPLEMRAQRDSGTAISNAEWTTDRVMALFKKWESESCVT